MLFLSILFPLSPLPAVGGSLVDGGWGMAGI